MITPYELTHRLMDVIEATEIEGPYEGAVRSVESVLALLISQMGPAQRAVRKHLGLN